MMASFADPVEVDPKPVSERYVSALSECAKQ